ncbi:MAG: hypothetical protein MRJ96_05680 [Nitrospirales bacterium]|nr:hypothetical protein [Nitrospira sp.]MDR4500924.1 hypothetical protein [Nitrospirales bacterium]
MGMTRQSVCESRIAAGIQAYFLALEGCANSRYDILKWLEILTIGKSGVPSFYEPC